MTENKDKIAKWEKSHRWVRVKFGGEYVADSKNVMLVWEHSHLPVYYFPPQDVRREFLEPTGRGRDGRETWHVRVGDQEASNAAYSYSELGGDNEALNGYIAFRWQKMDHWYEEEEEVFVHARDPYHRVDTIPSSRHIKVVLDGVTVADTRRPYLLFETGLPTRYYIHPDDVRTELLTPTDSRTRCPYKGIASYWSVEADGQVFKDIVWSYPNPIAENPKIEGLFSFYNEKVDIYVDGELEERPQTAWS